MVDSVGLEPTSTIVCSDALYDPLSVSRLSSPAFQQLDNVACRPLALNSVSAAFEASDTDLSHNSITYNIKQNIGCAYSLLSLILFSVAISVCKLSHFLNEIK